MAITYRQAKAAKESLQDVFIPNGDAGVIKLIYKHARSAYVVVDGTSTRNASEAWYSYDVLDTAETMQD